MKRTLSRRLFLTAAAGVPLAAAFCTRGGEARAAEPLPAFNWRWFELTTWVALPESKGAAELWLPLVQTAGVYQVALELHWQSNAQTSAVVHDARYGAPFLYATWRRGGDLRQLELVQKVAVRDRSEQPLLPVTEAERQLYLQSTPSVPTDGIVRHTAEQIVTGQTGARERLRAIYDWVVDHTYRDGSVRGCGAGNVKSMLQNGRFGGKCADINTLMVALARAAGFPARDVYGVRVADSRIFPCLGTRGDISKAQHCRAEIFLEGSGWFPLDPADVRKVILEQKLPPDSAEIRALRDRLFGSWEMNWAGYNSATDLELPGTRAPLSAHFLMYPHALTEENAPDPLDPATFRYELTSREVKA